MACFVDLGLFVLGHIFESFDGPETSGFLAEAGEGETNVPLGGEIVEAQYLSLGNLGCCYKTRIILLYNQIVVVALMIQVLYD